MRFQTCEMFSMLRDKYEKWFCIKRLKKYWRKPYFIVCSWQWQRKQWKVKLLKDNLDCKSRYLHLIWKDEHKIWLIEYVWRKSLSCMNCFLTSKHIFGKREEYERWNVFNHSLFIWTLIKFYLNKKSLNIPSFYWLEKKTRKKNHRQ